MRECRNKLKNMANPTSLCLKELKKRIVKIAKLTRQLFGADILKLPPFDIAINTERIPPEKIVKNN
jgi:cytidylate kinase